MSVPPRWLHCPRKGALVAGKFLPFKTPLGHQYDKNVPEECRSKNKSAIVYIEYCFLSFFIRSIYLINFALLQIQSRNAFHVLEWSKSQHECYH